MPRKRAPGNPCSVFQGRNPVNAGFFLTPDEAAEMIHADQNYTSDAVFDTFPWPQLEVEGIAPSMPRRAAGSDHGSDGALPSNP